LAPVGVEPTPSIVVMARLPIAPTGSRQERTGLRAGAALRDAAAEFRAGHP
jgi:hypothetical protein